MMVLCSKLLKSNILTLPSAPQLTKTSTLPAQNRTSKTSLSWAMSCVLAVNVGMSQIVQVVSMLEVMMSLGESVYQFSDVKGEVCSGVFELTSRARGCSFCVGWSRVLTEADRLMLLDSIDGCDDEDEGSDHRRKWSPEVARRSVDCLDEDGGSHEMRVTGYAQVASATLTKSRR